MGTIPEPMLAERKSPDIRKLKYPLMVSPKLDGIRATVWGGQLWSRTGKLIPNKWAQQVFGGLPDGIDGELILGPAHHPEVYKRSQSAVMTADGPEGLTFWLFDWVGATIFVHRYQQLVEWQKSLEHESIKVVPHTVCKDIETLSGWETKFVDLGFEGAMIRSLDGPYKHGRTTMKEGTLLKLKRWEDHEGVVLEVLEEMENQNEATANEFGRTKRSAHQAGKVGKDTFGAFRVRWDKEDGTSVEFNVGGGPGLTKALRAELWAKRDQLPGQLVTFKHFGVTPDGVPRFPGYKAIRHPDV